MRGGRRLVQPRSAGFAVKLSLAPLPFTKPQDLGIRGMHSKAGRISRLFERHIGRRIRPSELPSANQQEFPVFLHFEGPRQSSHQTFEQPRRLQPPTSFW